MYIQKDTSLPILINLISQLLVWASSWTALHDVLYLLLHVWEERSNSKVTKFIHLYKYNMLPKRNHLKQSFSYSIGCVFLHCSGWRMWEGRSKKEYWNNDPLHWIFTTRFYFSTKITSCEYRICTMYDAKSPYFQQGSISYVAFYQDQGCDKVWPLDIVSDIGRHRASEIDRPFQSS